MSAFSTSSIDKLIQPCKKFASMDNPDDGKPPFSFYPQLYLTPALEPQRPASPPSPSPYVINFKRRGPLKRDTGDGETWRQDTPDVDQDAVNKTALAESQKEALNTCMQERNPSLEFGISGYSENAEMAGNASENEKEAHSLDSVQYPLERRGSEDPYDKTTAQFNNIGQELSLNDHKKFASGLESSRFTSPRPSATFEEFFDAPDAPLDGFSSDDEGSSSIPVAPMLANPTETLIPRLREEKTRRTRAEDALTLLQRRWNSMVKKCSLIGISIACGENVLESERPSMQELFEQFSEKLVVARVVGGAVARAAFRAAKDEELESMMARKNQEIARLWDKLKYVELVNREMSQRNQEAIEIAQRRRRRHRKRQKWALWCFGSALCLGSAGLLCYKLLPWEKGGAWSMPVKGAARLESMPCQSCSTS